MAIARTSAIALVGLTPSVVDVEADISPGLPAFAVIGLPDAALGESRGRVRAAALNSALPITSRKLTISLSPAALPKHGGGFDLAIALAALAAAGDVPSASVASTVHIGELGLDGRLRPTPGVLPAVIGAARAGLTRVMVPSANADEARLVPGMEVVAVSSLRDAAIRHGAELDPVPVEAWPTVALDSEPVQHPDLADVVGNEEAVQALIAAAAGGHHLFLLGPPGAGKTMLAERLPGLLPDLDADASLEATSIRSLAGAPASQLVTRPPFEAPHHTATAAAMVGGGSGQIRPGAAVRASHGVLFLDEAPEFPSAVLDVLRQPLESGEIRIHRANAVATFPGRFQLIMAANPCPCGEFHPGRPENKCTCGEVKRREYRRKLSGPIADRIDITRFVEPVQQHELRDPLARPESSAEVLLRVAAARQRQRERYAGTPWRLNAHVPGPLLRDTWPLADAAARRLDQEVYGGALTRRGATRVHRLCWSVADLRGLDRPGLAELEVALRLRRAAPLDLDMIGGAA